VRAPPALLDPYIIGGNPGASHRIYSTKLLPPNPSRNAYEGWTMLGMLYGTGIIVKTPGPNDPAPFMFYCPVQFNPLLRYPDGWNTTLKRGGYAYRLSMDPNSSIPPFVVSAKDRAELKMVARGRFRRIMALTSDVIYADAGFGADLCVWSHDKPPYVIAGYSDGHAEAVAVPQRIYTLALEKISPSSSGSLLNKSDAMCMGMFQACDTKDFKPLETWLKSLP
jgi:hypothetical protein